MLAPHSLASVCPEPLQPAPVPVSGVSLPAVPRQIAAVAPAPTARVAWVWGHFDVNKYSITW